MKKITLTLNFLILFSLCLSTSAYAMCFLNFERGRVLDAGDASVAVAYSGGQAQKGLSIHTKMGIPKTLEVYFNSGLCNKQAEKTTIWGYAFEFGTKKEILSYQTTRLFELSWMISGISFSGANFSSIGFRSLFVGSIPFQISSHQGGYFTLGLGGQNVFQDEKNAIKSSQNISRALVLVGTGVEIVKALSINVELRWEVLHDFQAGAAVSYVF
jgi:hypothetical protein